MSNLLREKLENILRSYAISILNSNFYFFVGQKYKPIEGKWEDPYTETFLEKFTGDGSNTVLSSETEKCAYILGNSSLKVHKGSSGQFYEDDPPKPLFFLL